MSQYRIGIGKFPPQGEKTTKLTQMLTYDWDKQEHDSVVVNVTGTVQNWENFVHQKFLELF